MKHEINKQFYSIKQMHSSKLQENSTNIILESISKIQKKFSPFLQNCYGGFKDNNNNNSFGENNNDFYLISEYSSNKTLRLFLDDCIFESYYIDEMVLFLFLFFIYYFNLYNLNYMITKTNKFKQKLN
jgi:hypothetical protein